MKITIIDEIFDEAYDPNWAKNKEYKTKLNELEGLNGWKKFLNSDEYEDAFTEWRKELKKQGINQPKEEDFIVDPACRNAYEQWRESNNIGQRSDMFDEYEMNLNATTDEEEREKMRLEQTRHKYDLREFLTIVCDLVQEYGYQDGTNKYKPATWDVAADLICQKDGEYSGAQYLCYDTKFAGRERENEDWVDLILDKVKNLKIGEVWEKMRPKYNKILKILNSRKNGQLFNADLKDISYIMSPHTENFLMGKNRVIAGHGDADYLNRSETEIIAQYGPAESKYTAEYYPAPIGERITITASIVRYYDWAWVSVDDPERTGNADGRHGFWARHLYMKDAETGCLIAAGVNGVTDYNNNIEENIKAGKKLTITGKIASNRLGKQTHMYTTWLGGWLEFHWD